MTLTYKFFGLITYIELSYAEKKVINDIVRGYKFDDKEYPKIARAIRGFIQKAGNLDEVKAKVIHYMGSRYLKNWQRTTDSLIFEAEFWEWLINLNASIGFGLTELNNRNKTTGYIGLYNGVRCYVENK